MAWNKTSNKSLATSESKAAIGVGAPVAYNTAMAGRAYKDAWDIERAYREGVQKITWVSRAIDAIAGNQSRLPMILRKDNSPQGEIVTKGNKDLLDLFNTKANVGENSFIFRYRLSSQLLMSSRGVFIEKVRSRSGAVVGLHLLPPQHTAPIPDPRTFVKGFEVDMPNGMKALLRPEDVIWLRKPHPLDPYLSLTPMEAAGIAIEIENLAKVYNRNFLLNDGRPGGLVVIRGEIDDDDKDEIRNRFRGNFNRTGSVTVLSADDGVDYVDTSSSPRDANYVEMRQITKEEILAAFGVPESVIGNAAGRTFSNAAEELRVFWMETMMPHLELIARGIDDLDEKYYIDFDTSDVPILVVAKQERERYLLGEVQTGLISVNEYRFATGRKTVDSELADSLLSNPNLTPIANTEKKFEPEQQQQLDMIGATPEAGGPPPIQGAPPVEMAAPGAPVEQLPEGIEGAEPLTAEQVLSTASADDVLRYKSAESFDSDWDVKAEQATERWTEILDRSLERLFERQQRVVLEKALGAKSRKSIDAGTLEVESVFDTEVWNRQVRDDIKPVISAIVADAAEQALAGNPDGSSPTKEEIDEYVEKQMDRVERVNETTREEIAAAILIVLAMIGDSDEDKSGVLRAALIAIFANLLGRRRRVIAEHESQAAFNAGTFLTAGKNGAASKTWVTRKDSRVREQHVFLEGNTVGINQSFKVDGATLRFPGDPLAPPNLTINCRCRLRFGFR
jgi:HK97 family phage portal protein